MKIRREAWRFSLKFLPTAEIVRGEIKHLLWKMVVILQAGAPYGRLRNRRVSKETPPPTACRSLGAGGRRSAPLLGRLGFDDDSPAGRRSLEKLDKLVEALEANEDVQEVITNAE